MERGQGHIRGKGAGRWEISVSVGADPLTGRQRRKWRVVTGKKADAVKALRSLHDEVAVSYAGGSAGMTVGGLVAEYMRVTALAATTRDDYERVVRMWLPKRVAAMPLARLRPNDLDSLYAALSDVATPHRVARLHDVLSAAFGRAVKWGWITRNPAANATPPTPARRLARAPESEVVVELLERAGPVFATYLIVSFVTGARRGEVCGLQWGDVESPTSGVRVRADPDRPDLISLTVGAAPRGFSPAPAVPRGAALANAGQHRIWLRRAVVYTPATGRVVKDTKSERQRVVAVDPVTAGILAGHRMDMTVQLVSPIGPGTFVFTSDPAGLVPWRPDFATYRFGKLRRELGIEGVRLHDLRHAMATYALRQGFELPVVSKRLGHSRTSITADVYAHVMDGRDSDVADAMSEMLRRPE